MGSIGKIIIHVRASLQIRKQFTTRDNLQQHHQRIRVLEGAKQFQPSERMGRTGRTGRTGRGGRTETTERGISTLDCVEYNYARREFLTQKDGRTPPSSVSRTCQKGETSKQRKIVSIGRSYHVGKHQTIKL